MRIDRPELKRSARASMRNARPNALFVTFVYQLLTTGLSVVVSMLAVDPLGKILHLFQQGLEWERAIPLALRGVGWLGLFLNVLLLIFGLVMDFGYRCWCLKTAREEAGELSDLTGGFSMVGRILWLNIIMLAYGLLWYTVIFVPAFFLAGLLAFVMGPLAIVVAFVIALVAFLSRILRYTMAIYCLVDEPELGAAYALRRSTWMMQGRVWEYVLLILSFFGWGFVGAVLMSVAESAVIFAMGGGALASGPQPEAIAGSLAMSVVPALVVWPFMLWLTPYMALTECKFFDRIKGGSSDRAPF